jgi:predicted unusual protein kinase regulating ubiquinone biosynthesis (AarF/ABC1/UbiB family)
MCEWDVGSTDCYSSLTVRSLLFFLPFSSTLFTRYGKDPSEIFSEFDEQPLGSASIGQVHRAVLKDSGQEVAVKVQYPDSEKLFTNDMSSIR